MTATELNSGRLAFAARRWQEAFASLSAADRAGALDAEDLEQLGTAAYLSGNDSGWTDAWARAHQKFHERGDNPRAARWAFWLAFGFMNGGEMAPAGGWLARAQRLLDESPTECCEQGYLLLPGAIESCDAAPRESHEAFVRAEEIGRRFADPDLIAIARHGQARALIRLAQAARGMALLDEVMVAVTSGELSPIVVGDTYCGLIEACHETFDVRRAQEWTAALDRWCESQPELVPYRGQCLVYRASVMQVQGAWAAALREAEQACRYLSQPKIHPAAGAAYYQRAELHRLRGEFNDAEQAYRQADLYGQSAQPGLAQLRLVQGQSDIAAASIRRVVEETADRLTRLRVLPAYVEIMLAAGSPDEAKAGADELSGIASESGSPFLEATAAHATGAMLVASGEFQRGLTALRRAQALWRTLDAPYDAARTRVLIGLACRALGDVDGAALERQAAHEAFERLGAAPDLTALDRTEGSPPKDKGRLTRREMHILRLVATGKTNRIIAEELVLSEKTVARHVSNIFTKLDVSSRAGATAYAYDHHLLQPPT